MLAAVDSVSAPLVPMDFCITPRERVHDRRHHAGVVEDCGEHCDEDDRRQHDDGEDHSDLRDTYRMAGQVGDRNCVHAHAVLEMPRHRTEDHLNARHGEIEQLLDRELNFLQQRRRKQRNPAEDEVEDRSPDDDAPGEALRAARLADQERQDRECDQAEHGLAALRERGVRRGRRERRRRDREHRS
jgi:hypothetical protein